MFLLNGSGNFFGREMPFCWLLNKLWLLVSCLSFQSKSKQTKEVLTGVFSLTAVPIITVILKLCENLPKFSNLIDSYTWWLLDKLWLLVASCLSKLSRCSQVIWSRVNWSQVLETKWLSQVIVVIVVIVQVVIQVNHWRNSLQSSHCFYVITRHYYCLYDNAVSASSLYNKDNYDQHNNISVSRFSSYSCWEFKALGPPRISINYCFLTIENVASIVQHRYCNKNKRLD